VQMNLGDHPIEIAEETIVADLCLNGRLGVVLNADHGADDKAGAADLLDETLTLVLAALSGRPFRHVGRRWTSPATPGRLITVTPSAAQPELPLSVLGADRLGAGRSHGIPPVARSTDSAATMADAWQQLTVQCGGAAARWRRTAFRELDPGDADSGDRLVTSLGDEQRMWSLDTCIISLAPHLSLPERLRSIEMLGSAVRPRVQLDKLPQGVEAMWAAQRQATP
jgi:hypothetical protein